MELDPENSEMERGENLSSDLSESEDGSFVIEPVGNEVGSPENWVDNFVFDQGEMRNEVEGEFEQEIC